MSEIKFKVRYSALLLKAFTVSDIIKATGLNPESVRTELQRMRRDDLLISSPHPNKQKQRGGRPSIYRLSDNPEKLLQLSHSVESFYPPATLVDKPTSRYYKLARQLIDQALLSDSTIRDELLSEARNHLNMAVQAEGGDLATDLIKAYLEYERARLVYVSGDYSLALGMFDGLRKYFAEQNIGPVVNHIDEYILCLKASMSFVTRSSSRYRDSEWARHLLDILKENTFQTESPLVVLLLNLLRDLSRSPDKELIASIVEEVIEVNSLRAQRAELAQSENIDQVYQKNQAIEFLPEQRLSLKKDEAPIDVSGLWPRPTQSEDR